MDTKKFGYETWRVHTDITSKILFTEFKKPSDIEYIVRKRLRLDEMDNELAVSYVNSFLTSVDYEEIAKLINDSIVNKELNK